MKQKVNQKSFPPPQKNKMVYIPTIKNKTRYSTRERIEKRCINWTDDITAFINSSNNNISEHGYTYRTITNNDIVQYCVFNIDKELLVILKKDMDQECNKKN